MTLKHLHTTNIFFLSEVNDLNCLNKRLQLQKVYINVVQGVKEAKHFSQHSEIYIHWEKDLSILHVRFTVHRK